MLAEYELFLDIDWDIKNIEHTPSAVILNHLWLYEILDIEMGFDHLNDKSGESSFVHFETWPFIHMVTDTL